NASPEIVTEAEFSLAEVYFKRRHYSQARRHYEKVLNAKGRSAKGFAAYRLAWCDFYLGDFAAASQMAEKILNSPQLLTRTATVEVVQVDSQFQEEVARDYVTFLAQQKVTRVEAEKVY